MTTNEKVTITLTLDRTWVGSNESMARSIAETYLKPEGFKVHTVEVSLTPIDTLLLNVLKKIIHNVEFRKNEGSFDSIFELNTMLAKLEKVMKHVPLTEEEEEE